MTNTTVNKVIGVLDDASWMLAHHAQDWQMGITQRYLLNKAWGQAWRAAEWAAKRTDRLAALASTVNIRAYDGWVESGRAWEHHLDETIGRGPGSGRFFLAERGPRTSAEERAVDEWITTALTEMDKLLGR